MVLNTGDIIIVKKGIHKGKVFLVIVSEHKYQFPLIGDTVNTTSNMFSNSDKNCAYPMSK